MLDPRPHKKTLRCLEHRTQMRPGLPITLQTKEYALMYAKALRFLTVVTTGIL